MWRCGTPSWGRFASPGRYAVSQLMRLKIELPTTWSQVNQPGAAATFRRKDSSGAIQVSWGEYRGGELPIVVTAEFLKEMAEKFGQETGLGQLTESSGGGCRYGMYGTGVFQSAEHPRSQVWFVSDGRNIIMATHICDEEPKQSEIAEAQQIAASLALGVEHPRKPRWRFW